METPVTNVADEKVEVAEKRPTSRCQATTKKGTRCPAPCVRGRQLCCFHVAARDTDAMQLRAAHARTALAAKVAERRAQEKVNKCRALTSVEEAKRLLGILVAEMRNAKAAPKDIAAVVGAYLNAHQMLRDESAMAEIEEIKRRLNGVTQEQLGTVGGGTFGEDNGDVQ